MRFIRDDERQAHASRASRVACAVWISALSVAVAHSATAQVIESKPSRSGPGLPPVRTDVAAEGMGAGPPAGVFKAPPVKKAPPGSTPPSKDPHDFAGVWMSEIVQEQTL